MEFLRRLIVASVTETDLEVEGEESFLEFDTALQGFIVHNDAVADLILEVVLSEETVGEDLVRDSLTVTVGADERFEGAFNRFSKIICSGDTDGFRLYGFE